MSILAIDQGTTSTRAILFGSGTRRLVHQMRHAQHQPAPAHVEHDPEEILGHVRDCMERADGPVEAVALANQGESCLAWDAVTGRPVTPVLVWQDARTEPDVERLRSDGAEPLSLERTGLPLDPYFSASKLGWILRSVPEAAELHRAGRLRLGTTDAFFLQRLTGRCATDVTTASRTGLMDLSRLQWDEEMCRLHGVPVEALPPIVPTTGDFGAVRAGGREVPLRASVVDQQAALYGHGCREAGDAKITFGTGAFALAVAGSRRPAADGALPTVAWQRAGEPAVYALDGGVYAASAAVEWARGLGIDGAAFEGASAAERGLVFVPALAGLACPHWDRSARGAWLGLGLDTTRADMHRAVLEGVALRMGEVIAAMERSIALPGPIPIDGGMSANAHFVQFLADVLGRELVVSDEPELTARGAAELAADDMGVPFELGRGGKLVPPRPLPPGTAERFGAALDAVRVFARG